MLTDAKHVNCLGSKTKNMLHIKVVVANDNDPVARCHEQLETHEIYVKPDSAGVDVGIQDHDNNASITKLIRESRHVTLNRIDNLYARKILRKRYLALPEGHEKHT